ncbi:cytochrome P450 monooxygenase 1 [Heterobasidion irregulare TC 32-1]|uniref:Cytochrome P450 monooxygenase 1 n=1 Tax=Heterobasidion irregulare (strain TC 32-1) TaxID=747525 RepID=W4K124_HETIT|nr:cytochrome P450 monooxygenase 1 [Heterobasidion irregulare TC 32-1]ETW79538.1 cytochrome P450 monooxygenase 1 [Heterobasidion irregulare TC 32-1]
MFPTAVIVLSAIIAHVVFNRLEPRGAAVIGILILGIPATLSIALRASFTSLLSSAAFTLSNYLLSLISSLCIYRLSPFHPLARFPGPVLFKLSRIPAWILARSGVQHHYYLALHQRFGPYVRTGPNHLHVSDASAIPVVLGSRAFTKGGRYSAIKRPGSQGSLLSMSDPHEHSQRRRIWDRALNATALKDYQDSLANRVAQLVTGLEQRVQDGPLDLSEWISMFSFDFMGDLAYGSGFNLLEQGEDVQDLIRIVSAGVRQQELAGAIPWIKPFYDMLPTSSNDLRFVQFAKEMVLKRKAQETPMDEDGSGTPPLVFPTLVQESSLALVAGSDTSGTCLANIFYYLLSNVAAYRTLQSEIDKAEMDSTNATLAGLPYLNAVINETLRLQSVVPNGVQRVLSSKSEGVIISGNYIPPSTTVQVSTYIVHRDPGNFSRIRTLSCPNAGWRIP